MRAHSFSPVDDIADMHNYPHPTFSWDLGQEYDDTIIINWAYAFKSIGDGERLSRMGTTIESKQTTGFYCRPSKKGNMCTTTMTTLPERRTEHSISCVRVWRGEDPSADDRETVRQACGRNWYVLDNHN